ncbi:MAG: tetratricopeptide repeat protein [Bacteroidales bacterium]|jgi:CHAT domain-containing protein/tetratricopeptide (TPR) repeat protein
MNKQKGIFLLLFLCTISITIYAQNDLKADTIYAKKLLEKAIVFDNAAKYDSAISNYFKAGSIYQRLASNLSLPTNWASERFLMTLDMVMDVLIKITGYDQALKVSDFMINQAQIAFGERSKFVADAYCKRGLVYQNLDQLDNGLDYYLKALSIKTDLSGTDNLDVGSLYSTIGNIYLGKNEYDLALEYYNKALAILKMHKSERDLLVATSYKNIANVYAFKDNYYLALDYYLKSLDISKSTLGESNPSVVEISTAIGFTYRELGKYDLALDYLGKSLQLTKNIFGEKHKSVAVLYRLIGSIYLDKGDNDYALEFFMKSLAIIKEIPNEDQNEVEQLYNDVGLVYLAQGNYPFALDRFSESLKLSIKTFGEKDARVAVEYNNIGQLYNTIGDWSLALEYFFKALKIKIELNGDSSADVGTICSNIGSIYQDQGKQTLSLEYYQKALNIYIKIFGENHPDVALVYNNIATLYGYGEIFDYQKSFEYQVKAINIYKEILGEKSFPVATSYENFGFMCTKFNKYDLALEFYSKAIRIFKELFGEKNPSLVSTYNNIGNLYYKKGEYVSALEYYQKGIVANVINFEDSVNVNSNPKVRDYLHPIGFSNSLFGKANAFNKLNNYVASLHNFQLCDTLAVNVRKNRITESDKLELATSANILYENAIQFCVLSASKMQTVTDKNYYDEQSFAFSEKSKAGVLIEALSGQESLKFAGIPDSLLQREHALKVELRLFEKNIAESQDSLNKTVIRNQLFNLNRQYDELVAKFEKEYPNYYNLKYAMQNPTIKEIQNIIDDKTAIRSYFVGDSSVFIFTLTKNKLNVNQVPIIKNLKDSITWFRYGLTKTSQRMQEYYRRIGYLLYQQLFPISAPIDKNIENLIIIPDGILAIIPFESLLTSNITGNIDDYKNYPYLIKKYNISYSYSAKLFYRTFSKQKSTSIEITKLNDWLAFAPVFDDSGDQSLVLSTRELQKQLKWLKTDSLMTNRSMFDRNYITPLPATKTETEDIFKLYDDNNLKAKVLLHKDANEQFVKSGELAKYKILHFATHGFVNSERPELSGLVLAQDTTGGEDGILYSGEIYNLKLNADLVVLSACETGLGKIQKGEGIIGLTRALLYAGAKNIIVSLWQVADESTSNLMVDFYKNSLENKGKLSYSEALRNAKLKMIAEGKYAHPLFWSPFILIGK